ncbi:MAG TPA: hypothetical protein VK427_02955, partial [Kofleriaceae bacterium]|nr:hypothetical protein [Kofleriaceae bacterium]
MFDDDDGRGRVRWRAMAAELGGVLHAPGRRQADDWIEVFVADVRVWVDSYVERPGNMRHEYTRVRARVARGPAPRLHIRRQHFLHAIAKVFGAQDIVVGDPAFDAKYVVKSDSLPL